MVTMLHTNSTMSRVVITGFCLLASFAGFGKNYYLSGSGNDAAGGQSPQSAWRTFQRLSRITLKPGDTIFLNRGHVFEGGIEIRQSGTAGKPIVITAYGSGADPVISGAVPVMQWKALGGNRYETDVQQPVYDLFNGSRRLTPARYPNTGFLTVDKGYGKDSIESAALQQPDGFWNGATLRMRTIDWVYETRTVGTYQKGLIIQGPQNRYLIEKSFQERMQGGKIPLYNFQKGYGFYLEGLPQMVDTAMEWSWRNGKLLVQLPEGVQPSQQQFRAVVHHYGVWLQPRVQHVVISGMAFRHFEKAGVGGGWHLGNIAVKQNRFEQIHGAGVLFDSASLNCAISKNSFTDILGRGISALEAAGAEVSDNDLKRIGLSRGHGWTGVNGASGIVIHNVERKVQLDSTFAHHNVVRNNRVDSCGYNGIRVDGHHNLVEYNVVDHCSLTLNDGANLYCFAAGPGVTHNSVIRNNIVRNSVGDSEATPNNPNLAFGIYLDNNSSGMLVEGNTVIATGASGIVNNDASYDNTIRNNTVFNCKEGIGFAEWANVGKIYGLVVERNTVVGFGPKQKMISMLNWLAPKLDVGVVNNNLYINTGATNIFYYATKQIPEATRLELSFEQYQRLTLKDADSKAVTAHTDWAKGLEPMILVNDTHQEKVVDNGAAEHWLADGSKAPGRVTIAPFASLVLLKKKINIH